jgi:hypothetical protein
MLSSHRSARAHTGSTVVHSSSEQSGRLSPSLSMPSSQISKSSNSGPWGWQAESKEEARKREESKRFMGVSVVEGVGSPRLSARGEKRLPES